MKENLLLSQNIVTPEVHTSILYQAEQRGWGKEGEEKLGNSILEETFELVDAVVQAEIGASAWEVASEVGDVLILTAQYLKYHGNLDDALASCLDYTLDVCERTGIDPNEAILMKLTRNELKYPIGMDQTEAKKQWHKNDYQFSEEYGYE